MMFVSFCLFLQFVVHVLIASFFGLDFFIVQAEGSCVFTSLSELTLFHALSDIPEKFENYRLKKVETG